MPARMVLETERFWVGETVPDEEKCGMTFEKMIEMGSQPVAQYAVHALREEAMTGNANH
jgi:hypothetical protein